MLWTALLAVVLWPAVARAEWWEASSDHFVIYADESEGKLRLGRSCSRWHSILTAAILPTPRAAFGRLNQKPTWKAGDLVALFPAGDDQDNVSLPR